MLGQVARKLYESTENRAFRKRTEPPLFEKQVYKNVVKREFGTVEWKTKLLKN